MNFPNHKQTNLRGSVRNTRKSGPCDPPRRRGLRLTPKRSTLNRAIARAPVPSGVRSLRQPRGRQAAAFSTRRTSCWQVSVARRRPQLYAWLRLNRAGPDDRSTSAPGVTGRTTRRVAAADVGGGGTTWGEPRREPPPRETRSPSKTPVGFITGQTGVAVLTLGAARLAHSSGAGLVCRTQRSRAQVVNLEGRNPGL